MNHENGDRCLGFFKNGYTQDSKVHFRVGEDLQLLIKGPKGIYIHHDKYDSGFDSLKHEFTYFFKDAFIFMKLI